VPGSRLLTKTRAIGTHDNPAVDLAAKLQLRPGTSIRVVGPPPGLDLGLPAEADAEALLVFVRDRGELEQQIGALAEAAGRDALTWVAYPKAGQLGTDLSRNLVVEAFPARGARTVRAISIDETWSALRLRPA
jgi:hypothetical protein